ncbi:LOW QUALITY PROTEIN: hypothetical protein NC653_018116 [Populus alba x Populus x berolinensis]|uniref:Uncharacterized protein n=1 Tax=Populus alba x Populus x berolinensis TaxID=444605 RepID=A0AAD6QSG1_9ROSI|nr:LOW QUALITY PROTEIN: hypothetical protein NC653_018116 [Populus alba x Populus x berolinensis]
MKLAGLKSIENAHDESVWAATWIPATETRPALLMTGSLDETVKLWKPDELTLERTNTGHCLGVVSRILPGPSPHRHLSIASFECSMWTPTQSIATLEAPPSEVWQMQFDPKLLVVEVHRLQLWDTEKWKLIATLSIPRQEGPKPTDKNSSKKFVLSVAWSPDGNGLLVAPWMALFLFLT